VIADDKIDKPHVCATMDRMPTVAIHAASCGWLKPTEFCRYSMMHWYCPASGR